MAYEHLHRSPEIGRAIQQLLDALSSYERTTGREFMFLLLPLKSDDIPVCSLRGPLAPRDALNIISNLPHIYETDDYLHRSGNQ